MSIANRTGVQQLRLAVAANVIAAISMMAGDALAGGQWTGNIDGKWSTAENWSPSPLCFLSPPCVGIKPDESDRAFMQHPSNGPANTQRIILDSNEVIGTFSIDPEFYLSVENGSLDVDGQSTAEIIPLPTYGSVVENGGVIRGHGTLNFATHPDAERGDLPLVNSGRIAAENGTLTLSSLGSAFDLDGPNRTGVLDVNDWRLFNEPPDGVKLKVVGQVEPFAGQMLIGQSDTAEFDSLYLGDESGGATVEMRPLQTSSICFGILAANCTATLATTNLRIDHPDTVIDINDAGFANGPLNNGTARFTGNVDFVAGTLVVGSGTTAQFEDNIHFRQGSNTNLEGIVRLSDAATIDLGANFNGSGALLIDGGAEVDVIGDATANTFVINNGVITLDSGSGGTEFTVANFDQNSGGEIRFDVTRPLPNSYDRLHVGGTATLEGTATVSHLGATPLSAGDEFTLIDATNGISGQFATVNLPTLDSGLEWSTIYSSDSWMVVVNQSLADGDFDQDGSYTCADINALSAEIIAGSTDPNFDLNADGQITLADQDAWLGVAGSAELHFGDPFFTGDLDLDSEVNSTDLGRLLNNFGDATGLPYCSGNLNADMHVDSTDLGLLLNNFGQDANPPALTSAVPEPRFGLATMLLLIAGCHLMRRTDCVSRPGAREN